MLYLGRTPLYRMGNRTTKDARMPGKYSKCLYVKDACLIADYNQRTAQTRDSNMDRVYDWLNYQNQPIGSVSTGTGFEVEATFVPVSRNNWSTLWGLRVGTSGRVTRANIIVGSSNTSIQSGVSYSPADNEVYAIENMNRKLHIRFICKSVTNPTTYTHEYTLRTLVTDADTNQTIVDETETFGDNFTSDAMTSTYTTFYRFHSAWFSRNRYANPAQNVPQGNDFEGYFYGGAVYIIKSNDNKVPVQYLTPVKKGQFVAARMTDNPSIGSFVATADGIVVETLNIANYISDGSVGNKNMKMMTNCASFTNAILRYED